MTEAIAPTETEITEFALSMHKDGSSEDDIIDGIRSQFKMSVIKAIRAFKAFQKTAGLIMTNAEKSDEAEKLILANITENDEGKKSLDQPSAVTAISEKLELSNSASRRYIKKFASKNADVTIVGGTRKTVDLSEYEKLVVGMIGDGKGRTVIAEYLEKMFDSVEDIKRGKRIYSQVARKHDLLKHRENVDYTEAFKWLADQEGLLEKAATRTKLESMGYSTSASNRFFKGVQFMAQKHLFDTTGSAVVEVVGEEKNDPELEAA